MSKPVTWKVLTEKPRYEPCEARVMFSRQNKGNPRVYFNVKACALMKLGKGARIELLAPENTAPGAAPLLGLRTTSGEAGAQLWSAGKTKSLMTATSALPHLVKLYRKILFRPRLGKEGEPPWVLDAISSEKGAQA
jgi:hypothetical protein